MKTPEEMAEEYADLCVSDAYYAPLKAGFLAGYKAGCENTQTQLAVGEKTLRELLGKPQWISVKDRLPAPQEEVLWWNKAAHQAGVSSYEYMPYCNDTMIEWGDAGNVSIKNFTHWMELPAPPKEEE